MSALNSKRLPSLDGLRGIAIIIVVMSHATATSYASIRLHAFTPYFNGYLAVRAFFIMSGYLITGLLLKEKEKTGRISLKNFYFRRFFRLFPVQVSYIAIVFAITTVSAYHVPACSYLTALTYTKNYACMAVTDGHFWTLSVEEQFYLIWALAFVMLPRRGLLIMAFTLVSIAPISRAIEYHGGNHNWWWLTSNSDALMIGCLTALEFKKPWLRRVIFYRPKIVRACTMILILIPIVLANYLLFGLFTVTLGPLLQDVCLAYLICSWLLIRQGLSYRIVNLRFFIYAGSVSYSVYIWQQIFFYTNNQSYGLSDSFIFHFPANLALAIAVGLVSFYLIEQPMMSVRRRLAGPGHSAARDRDDENFEDRSVRGGDLAATFSLRPGSASSTPID